MNVKHKKAIRELRDEITKKIKAKEELDAKFLSLKQSLSQKQKKHYYKPLKSEQLDEQFAKHINEAQLDVPVKRLATGKYLFGTQ